MNKLVPLSKFSKKAGKILSTSQTKVVVDKNGTPLGFVFGRNSFIDFLEKIDTEFHENVKDSKKAYNNPAGKLIDLIEENLPLNPKFVKDLQKSVSKKQELIPLDTITRSLNA